MLRGYAGNTKEQAAAAVRDLWRRELPDGEADAALIAEYGRREIQRLAARVGMLT